MWGREWEALVPRHLRVPNAPTTLGHSLLRFVVPTRDLRSPNGATGNSQGRKPLDSGTP